MIDTVGRRFMKESWTEDRQSKLRPTERKIVVVIVLVAMSEPLFITRKKRLMRSHGQTHDYS